MNAQTAPATCPRCTPSLYYPRSRPCRYLAGHNDRPSIALAELSRTCGYVSVKALYAQERTGRPCSGAYVAGGADADEPHGARLAMWTRRTAADAERLLLRADVAPQYRGAAWRVVPVGEAVALLLSFGYAVRASTDADAYTDEDIFSDEDPAGRWRAPRLEIERSYSLSAFVIPA